MKNLGCFKDFKVRPLDGAFDARTPSGELNFYDFRVVLNMDLTDQRKRCRMGGWQKLLSDSPFGFLNQDLHDQMLGCQTYYESLNLSGTYGPILTGYSYPIWYPGPSFPDEFVSEEIGLYYGYPPDFYTQYPPYPTFGNFMCEVYIGYPYNGSGDSFYELCYGEIIPGYTDDGYGAGDPIPNYLGPYQYDYNYCGNYAFNRDHLCREAITLLYEVVSVGGRRKLLAGTKSRLYALNERAGNWRILLDGQSGAYAPDNCDCAQRRFKVAQVGNIVIITNNFDPVMTWEIDAGPSGCDLWSTEYVTDLLLLGIQKAGVVAAWQGFAFLADVQVENERHGSRIYWSDLNAPREWIPGGESIAGYVDLGLGEVVVAISPIGGQLRVYTTRGDEKSIYAVSIVGGTEILSFNEIYRGPDGIEYENSLVNTGDTHVWFSSSGIMVLGEYDRTPHRIEWIYKADSVFYNGLPGEWVRDFDGLSGFGPVNKEVCHNVVGGFNSERKQIWFSWATDGNTCANMSLVLNPVYRAATLVDHGFTAFLTYRPDYTTALRDFLAQYAGCDPSELVMPKEGQPLPVEMGYMPSYIRNETEDPDLPPVSDSVCGYLNGVTLEDLCEACGVESLFVMASALDKTLKEFTPNQCFRERYVPTSCELSITIQPVGVETSAGNDIELTVAFTGAQGDVAIQWYKDGIQLSNGASAIGTVTGATSATLAIADATTAATGTYTVRLVDRGVDFCVVDSNPVTIAVGADCDLDITTQPVDQEIVDGNDLELTFAFTGAGGPFTIQWYLNDAPLSNGASGSSNISGATTDTLTVTGWTSALAGAYTAIVTDTGTDDCVAQTEVAVVEELTAPSNMYIWYKADGETRFSDGQEIDVPIQDFSINGLDMTIDAHGSAIIPVYETGELNSLPIFDFPGPTGSGTDVGGFQTDPYSLSGIGFPVPTTGFTIAIVVKRTVKNLLYNPVTIVGLDSLSSVRARLYSSAGDTDVTFTGTGYSTDVSLTVNLDEWQVITVTFDNAEGIPRIRTNDLTAAGSVGIGNPSLNFTSMQLPAIGGIAEILLYNTALTGDDLTQLRNYLSAKWGIAITV